VEAQVPEPEKATMMLRLPGRGSVAARPEDGGEALGSIAYYMLRGHEVQAKLYIPLPIASRALRGPKRRVTLIYRGEALTVSASRAGSRTRGVKAYLPSRIVHLLIGFKPRPQNALLEAHDGAIEILGVGWRCRICGRFTASPDKLCWGHRIEGEGICKRCGRRLEGDSTLCDGCFEQLARAMGYPDARAATYLMKE
jgi:hypothetical protein